MHRSGPHGEVLVRGILISVLGHSGPSLYGSGPGRVSISHLGRISCSRAPRRSARHTTGSAPTKSRSRARGGNARSSPTKKACGGQPRSRRPPGGRVAAWDRKLQIYHDEINTGRCVCDIASRNLSLQEHQRQRVQNVQVTRSGPQCSERSGTARSTVCKLDHFTTASHLIKLVYHCKSSNQTSTRIAGAKGPVGAVGPAGCYMKGW